MTTLRKRSTTRRSRTYDRRGQTLVEAALVLPVFVLILFGLIDGGRFVYTDSVMSQAAREGARLAAVEAKWLGKGATDDPSCVADSTFVTAANPGKHVCPANTTSLLNDVKAAVNRMVAGVGSITQVYIRCDPNGTSIPASWVSPTPPTCDWNADGDAVSIRVEFVYKPLTPIAGQIIGSVSRTASATMTVN